MASAPLNLHSKTQVAINSMSGVTIKW